MWLVGRLLSYFIFHNNYSDSRPVVPRRSPRDPGKSGSLKMLLFCSFFKFYTHKISTRYLFISSGPRGLASSQRGDYKAGIAATIQLARLFSIIVVLYHFYYLFATEPKKTDSYGLITKNNFKLKGNKHGS